jgi:hypothetical protein
MDTSLHDSGDVKSTEAGSPVESATSQPIAAIHEANPALQLLRYLQQLPTRELVILRSRIVRRSATLEQLGEDFAVTRERVRQLEDRLKHGMLEFADGPGGRPIRQLALEVRKHLGAAIPIPVIAEHFPKSLAVIQVKEDRHTVALSLLWLGGPYETSGDATGMKSGTTPPDWLVLSTDLFEQTKQLLQAQRDSLGWIAPKTATESLSRVGIRPAFHAAWLQANGFFRLDGGWMLKKKLIRDTAEQILRYKRIPMTCAELNAVINGNTLDRREERLLRRRLIRDRRFERIADSLALRE